MDGFLNSDLSFRVSGKDSEFALVEDHERQMFRETNKHWSTGFI